MGWMTFLRVTGWLLTATMTAGAAADEKLIVVHVRGGAFEHLRAHIENGDGGYLRTQFENGRLRKLTPIENAVTISNIASFETGVFPSMHGIVGHTFGTPENGFDAPVSGFSKAFGVETYWEKAAAAGKQVLSIGALITHGKYRQHENVDVWAQGRQLAGAQIISIEHEMENRKIALAEGVEIVLRFGLENGSVVVDRDTDSNNGDLGKLRPGSWLDLEFEALGNGLFPATRLLHLGDRIYIRSIYINQGAPAAFVSAIDRDVGPSTGWPNIPFFAAGTLEADVIEAETHREIDRIMDVFAYAPSQKQYDLIMIDYPVMDRLGHAFLQLAHDGKAISAQKIKRFYQVAHERLGSDMTVITDYARSNGFELIIASGHGFSPIHTAINLNGFIEDAGLSTQSDWEVRGFPGKVSGHIYANPALPAEQQQNRLQSLADAFRELTNPQTGELVVENIVPKDQLAQVHLDHPHSGDMFIQLKPGYIFQPQFRSERPVFDVPMFKGDHGYSTANADSFGFVISGNAEITHVTDIAPYVSGLLNADGVSR